MENEKTEQVAASVVPTTEKVTEEELRKSLEVLEGKQPQTPEQTKEQTVQTETLAKSAKEAVAEKGTEELKKAIEVSKALKEFSEIIGIHVDESLQALQKSVNEAAQRDLAFTRIVEKLAKSVNDMSAKVEEFGKAHAAEAKSVTTTSKEVLQKSAGAGGEQPKALDPKEVLMTLEGLAKSAKDEQEKSHWINAAIRFESARDINPADFVRVKKELGR